MNSNIVKYALLSMPLTSFGLGIWQIRRLEWKKGVIKELDEKIVKEPIDLLSIESLEDLNDLEYQPVKVKGHFDPDPKHQLYLEPRTLVVNREALFRGRTAHQQSIGVNVITPFHVDGTNLRVLVNRGWLSRMGRDNVEENAHIGLGKETDSIEVVGLLRKSDKRPRYGLKNNEATNFWQVRDVDAIARVLNTAPVFIDAKEDESRTDGPYGGQTQLNVRNEHLNYAITWFSLSALCVAMWYTKYGKRGIFKFKRTGR